MHGMTRGEGVDVAPLSAALGAVVRGVDLGRLPDEQFDAVYAAWLEHKVLFFPDQDLTPEDHRRFGQRIGALEVHPYTEGLEGYPEITVLHSENGGRADVWHSDATFQENPPIATILRYMTGPARGGDTMWSNQCLAYEKLSEPFRALINGMTAVHTAAVFQNPEITVEHPVIRVHPENGSSALYVNRLFTSHIPQLHPDESRSLLEHLFAWSAAPELTCRWSWKAGDVVMWDNRSTQHYAVNDYVGDRIMQRVTVLGTERPAGAPGTWPHWPDDGSVPVSAKTGFQNARISAR